MKKALIVEDDKLVLTTYKAAFEHIGFEFISAEDGESGLQKALAARPDIIVTGIMMPKLNGFDMIDCLKNAPETASIPILVVSALSNDDDKARAFRLGAVAYLDKKEVTAPVVAQTAAKILANPSTKITSGGAAQPKKRSKLGWGIGIASLLAVAAIAGGHGSTPQPSSQPVQFQATNQTTTTAPASAPAAGTPTTTNNTAPTPSTSTQPTTCTNGMTDAVVRFEQQTPNVPPSVSIECAGPIMLTTLSTIAGS